ncbi:MAG: formyltetrahydrofolate deformylase [Verrucomicrobiaceae bacterium]|nr:formyltetrahydrofolate deformylase [Verrucomicrobiaceae bacterium]
MATATLLIHCPDQPGLVNTVTGFILYHGGNILHLDQHVDRGANVFFMRVEWALEGFALNGDAIRNAFAPIAKERQMAWNVHLSEKRRRVALFVTKEGHCLYDLLSRHEAGELPCDLPVIVSNHEHLKPAAERFGIPFVHTPVTATTKAGIEAEHIALMKAHEIDTIVLARYMQIITPGFIEAYPNQIINIHHSFLPAFVGAKPYHQAHERGVKLIGATSHYVTTELDQGPIIDQDVSRVSHRDSATDMVRLGKDLEKIVLSRALLAHLTNRVLVYGNRTVVF